MAKGSRTRPASRNALRMRKIKDALAIIAETQERLAQLPDGQREALLKTLESGGSYEDVAKDLRLSPAVLEEVLKRARENLRRMIVRKTPQPH